MINRGEVFIVVGGAGDYSAYHEWPVAAYLDAGLAELRCALLARLSWAEFRGNRGMRKAAIAATVRDGVRRDLDPDFEYGADYETRVLTFTDA